MKAKSRNLLICHDHNMEFMHWIIFLSNQFLKVQILLKKASIPVSFAKRLLSLMRDYKIIKTIKELKGRRSGMYFFEELINITEN